MVETNRQGYSVCKNIIKVCYIAHLIIVMALTIFILFIHPDLIAPSITFAMLIIYGFMGPWLLLVAFVFISCRKQERAVCVTRILAKFLIFLFPVFGLISISRENGLRYWQMGVFLVYMGVVCVLLLAYELISWCCLGERYPQFLFAPNDLDNANAEVQAKRKEYNQMISKI